MMSGGNSPYLYSKGETYGVSYGASLFELDPIHYLAHQDSRAAYRDESDLPRPRVLDQQFDLP